MSCLVLIGGHGTLSLVMVRYWLKEQRYSTTGKLSQHDMGDLEDRLTVKLLAIAI